MTSFPVPFNATTKALLVFTSLIILAFSPWASELSDIPFSYLTSAPVIFLSLVLWIPTSVKAEDKDEGEGDNDSGGNRDPVLPRHSEHVIRAEGGEHNAVGANYEIDGPDAMSDPPVECEEENEGNDEILWADCRRLDDTHSTRGGPLRLNPVNAADNGGYSHNEVDSDIPIAVLAGPDDINRADDGDNPTEYAFAVLLDE